MIWDKLNEKLIFTNVDVRDTYDLFEKLGGEFIRYGFCKKSYIDALKEREASFATGLQIEGMGVAIPHTDPQHVIKEGIAIATLKNPVCFHHMGSDDVCVDVRVVIMLAIPSAHHMAILQSVILLIQNVELIQDLLKASDPKEVIAIIKRKESEENESL